MLYGFMDVLLQVMSHLVLLCAVCVESLTPPTQADSKRKRKKKSAVEEVCVMNV